MITKHMPSLASGVSDALEEELHVAVAVGGVKVELVDHVGALIVDGLHDDDGVTDMRQVGLGDGGLGELEAGGDGHGGPLEEGQVVVLDALAGGAAPDVQVDGSVVGEDGTVDEGQVARVDGVDEVAGELLGGLDADVGGAGGHGDGGQDRGEDGGELHLM